jgi:hypothetical protein
VAAVQDRSSDVTASSLRPVTLPFALWPRLHLIELHEQAWVPEVLRRAATDYLTQAIAIADSFAPLAPRLVELCKHTSMEQFTDLCAGASGPWLRLHRTVSAQLGRPVHVTMTDLYPNKAAFAHVATVTNGTVVGEDAPVDARAVPEKLRGIRTMFDCFHHFKPREARAVLFDVYRRREPIVIAEGTRRSLAAVLGMLLAPLLVLLLTPRIRPFSWSRLVLTYLVPIVPLLVLWDGVVSCLRSYRPRELRALTAGLDEQYSWEVGTYWRRGNVVTFLVGLPSR